MRLAFIMISSVSVFVGCTGERQPSAIHPPSPLQASLGNPTARGRVALKLDECVPALACVGWLNGPPPNIGEPAARFVVIDVWGRWCSEVPKSVPGLKQLHEEFGPKGVAFVSLTTENRVVVEQFVNTHCIPWSSGYQATLEMIDAIGASNVGTGTPGY